MSRASRVAIVVLRILFLGTPQTPIATLDTGLIEENKDKRKG
ncbi:hypothetical protein [Microcystis sp. M109S1]|nr:hypothetical protein [Microcystis sp. M109S1]